MEPVIIQDLFSQGGILSQYFPAYEERQEQVQMAEFIEEALFEGTGGIAEAGTGTGKTLAYSIPLIAFSVSEGKKVAISTETRTLQKQLTDREIPLAVSLIESITGKQPQWSLCLGGSNYLCRYRFEKWVRRNRYPASEFNELKRIRSLSDKRIIINRFDVNISDKTWDRISKLPDACLGKRCPWFTVCSHRLAKEEWKESDVLIMNHYLFFANIQSSGSILPDFSAVVFDEAHSVEDICSRQMGIEADFETFEDIISSISSAHNKKKALVRLVAVPDEDQIIDSTREVLEEAREFFDYLGSLLENNESYYLFREKPGEGESFVFQLEKLLELLRKNSKEFSTIEETAIIYDQVMADLYFYTEAVKTFIYQSRKRHVYWAEKINGKKKQVGLHAQPVEVASILKRDVYPLFHSVFFVSATLAVQKSFSYLEYRLGLTEVPSVIIQSPFDYQHQAVLYTPDDLPGPDDENFSREAEKRILQLLQLTGGNSLVLFTSYAMMNSMALTLHSAGFPVFSQGDMTASEAIDRYRENNGGVLLGTHSMWQGIDLPGELLRSVIVVKLPFDVPDTPITQARVEDLYQKGIQPFNWYILPQAVIRFKQGFGRLIRTATDKGIVSILDTRIMTKTYGKTFLGSLPECRRALSFEDLQKEYHYPGINKGNGA